MEYAALIVSFVTPPPQKNQKKKQIKLKTAVA